MSDEPVEGTDPDSPASAAPADGPPAVAAPWERPRRWRQERLDATRVDDLLARLGSDPADDQDGRTRRSRRRAAEAAAPTGTGQAPPVGEAPVGAGHAADPDSSAISAQFLIASLGDGAATGAHRGQAQHSIPPNPDESPLSDAGIGGTPPAGPVAADPTPSVPSFRPLPDLSPIGPRAVQDAAQTPADPTHLSDVPDVPAVSASGGSAADPAVAGADPLPAPPAPSVPPAPVASSPAAAFPAAGFPAGEDSSGSVDADLTTIIPRITAAPTDTRSILDSLNRSAADPAAGGAGALPPTALPPTDPPPGEGGAAAQPSGTPPKRPGAHVQRGWLYAGRSTVAVLSVVLLAVMFTNWRILRNADDGLADHHVAALQPDDPNLVAPSTAAAAATTGPAPTYTAENILLLGSDSRVGDNSGTSAGGDDGSANSDTMMIAHVSADRQHVVVLSIPRDTLVPAPTCKTWDYQTGKISDHTYPVDEGEIWQMNSAYSVGGPTCAVTAVQLFTGIRIDRMIGIDFAGFQAMVDALGGIQLDICQPIIDHTLGTVVASGGVQTVQGQQALNLVRAREVASDNGLSDPARIHRQQEVLSAILRQVNTAGTLLNPGKLSSFLSAFTSNTYSDNVTLEDLVDLAGSFGSLTPGKVTFYTLPTVPSTKENGRLDPIESQDQLIFNAFINDTVTELPGQLAPTTSTATTPTVPATPTTTALLPSQDSVTVAPGQVQLKIYNLADRGGLAGEAQTILNGDGFQVTDDDLVRPDDETQQGVTVQYGDGNRAAALTVAAAVKGATLVQVPGLGEEVRLMLGSDFSTDDIRSVQVGDTVASSLQTDGSTAASADSGGSSSSTETLDSSALNPVNAESDGCI